MRENDPVWALWQNDDCWYPGVIVKITNISMDITVKWLNPAGFPAEIVLGVSHIRERVEYPGQEPPFVMLSEEAILAHSTRGQFLLSSPQGPQSQQTRLRNSHISYVISVYIESNLELCHSCKTHTL